MSERQQVGDHDVTSIRRCPATAA